VDALGDAHMAAAAAAEAAVPAGDAGEVSVAIAAIVLSCDDFDAQQPPAAQHARCVR